MGLSSDGTLIEIGALIGMLDLDSRIELWIGWFTVGIEPRVGWRRELFLLEPAE